MNKFDILKGISISEKEFTKTSYEKFKKALVYIKNYLINSDGNMYMTVDFLIEINSLITGSNNVTLRKVNVKPYGLDKLYMDKDLIEDELYQIIDQFNDGKITPVKFYSIFKQNTSIL